MDLDDNGEHQFESERLRWENIVFLPYHPLYKILIVIAVLLKTYMGPTKAIQGTMHCTKLAWFDGIIKELYSYYGNAIYLSDILLHIAHRQVRETAVRREYLPKPVSLLFVDVIGIIPFLGFYVTNVCTTPVTIFPNVLAFTEFVIIYRIIDYFNIVRSHSITQLFAGFTIVSFLFLNCLRCFWYLMTTKGFCIRCTSLNNTKFPDWREIFHQRSDVNKAGYSKYALNYITSLFFGTNANFIVYIVNQRLSTTLWQVAFLLLFFCIKTLFVVPKMFAEGLLGCRHLYTFQKRVEKIVEVARRRTRNSPKLLRNIEKFYQVMWSKRSGTLALPQIIHELPMNLILEINEDLYWPLFHHSPSLRKTTIPYKRWLSGHIHFEYKMPGDKLFSGPLSSGNLFYIKAGIVQLISLEDNATPILSVTSGTLFGDINFMLPALRRKVRARCVTYCEIHYISRKSLLRSLHKFPEDRRMIMQRAYERISHARDLVSLKNETEYLDRPEKEGVAWIKKRWWQLSLFYAILNSSSATKVQNVELPPEESIYHCSKYIGQLVLYKESKLHNRSIFAKYEFPWTFSTESSFSYIWLYIVKLTVISFLLIYPPYLSRADQHDFSITAYQFWIDFVFFADIIVGFVTHTTHSDITENVATVILKKISTRKFILDVLSTSLLSDIAVYSGNLLITRLCQFSRLLKLYIFFMKSHIDKQDFETDPVAAMFLKCCLIIFSFFYIGAYFLFLITENYSSATKIYFFCNIKYIVKDYSTQTWSYFEIFKSWIVTLFYNTCIERSNFDIYTVCVLNALGFFLACYMNGSMIASLYFRHHDKVNFQFLISRIKTGFIFNNIHPILIMRLEKYFQCIWKSDHITYDMKEEPYSIHYTLHNKVAEKIIASSRAFLNADPVLIKEIANAVKYMIVPQYATFFMLGSQCDMAVWSVHGFINVENVDAFGNKVSKIYKLGEMLSTSSVFFGNIAIKTYTATTDCEVFYLPLGQFWDIVKRYPEEYEIFQSSQREIVPVYDKLINKYVYQTQKYRKALLMMRKQSFEIPKETVVKRIRYRNYFKNLFASMWIKPDSEFTRHWMTFRTCSIVVSLVLWSYLAGSGCMFRRQLNTALEVADWITVIDITLKLFMGYFNEDGLIIYDKKMCLKHYLARGFTLDVIGVMPWHNLVGEHFRPTQNLLVMTLSRTAHLYIVDGYFNYMGNRPNSNFILTKVVKFHVLGTIMMLICSVIDVSMCIDLVWDENYDLINITLISQECWKGKGPELIPSDLSRFFARAVLDSLSEFVRTVDSIDSVLLLSPFLFCFEVGVFMFYWLMYITSVAMLILNDQETSLFQDGIRQLKLFLYNERIEKHIIKRSVDYYTYMYTRTCGVGMAVHTLIENTGFVLKQDISHYFYKRALKLLGDTINLSAYSRRNLASYCEETFFLPGEDIMREMDVVPHIFIVNRGEVVISKNKQIVERLEKGAIFGQLSDTHRVRPVRVTAWTQAHADILVITHKRFLEITTEKTKLILNDIGQNDYIVASKSFKENPYNSIAYLARGNKTIQMPWMKSPTHALESKWYSRWLFLTWLLEPACSACLSILFIINMDTATRLKFTIGLVFLDLIHVTYAVTDFLYALHTEVVDDKCVLVNGRHDRLRQWGFIADLLTLIPPYLSVVTRVYHFHLARMARIRYMLVYQKQFCSSYERGFLSIIYRVIALFVMVHILCCVYIKGICEETIDTQFVNTNVTRRFGDVSGTIVCSFESDYKADRIGLIKWSNAYLYTLGALVTMNAGRQFHAEDEDQKVTTTWRIMFEMLVQWFLYGLDLYLMSKVTCMVYVKLRRIYNYDYNVRQLIHYLKDAGVTQALLKKVQTYTTHLWDRQRGNWIPELALQAPQCLREDIMCSLYLHHLLTPSIFRTFPDYFLRQLASNFRRIVIFPESHIVKAGDIMPFVFFINEGEVEKYYTDKHGDRKLMSLLTNNGYFGEFPGIFPNTPFQCSYYSRTVVDLVYLRCDDWKNLLECYPDIKKLMSDSARQLGVELGIHEAFFNN